MSQLLPSEPIRGLPNRFAGLPGAYPPPPQHSNLWLWTLLGIGGVGILIFSGGDGFGWYGYRMGTGVLGSGLVTQLNADPVARRELGNIQSAQFDMLSTSQSARKPREEGGRPQAMVFHVVGDKASGDVLAEQDHTGKGIAFKNAVLVFPGGKEIRLGF